MVKQLMNETSPEEHQDIIYSLLTPLSENPSLLYKSIFSKISHLKLNEDITNKAVYGLSKLSQNN